MTIFQRVFDDKNRDWYSDPEINVLFLTSQENYLNDLLKMRGHVFVNEVFDRLGFPRTRDGQVYGWVYSSERKDHIQINMRPNEESGSINIDFENVYYILEKIEGS